MIIFIALSFASLFLVLVVDHGFADSAISPSAVARGMFGGKALVGGTVFNLRHCNQAFILSANFIRMVSHLM